MLFSSIPGLQEVKDRIIQSVQNNHLAHALLFHGPEGSANLQMALALSTYLHCESPTDSDACGNCPSCHRMAKLVHPDMNFVVPTPGEEKDDDDKKKKVDFIASFRDFALKIGYGNVSDWIYHNGIDKKQLNISRGTARNILRTISLKSFEGGYKIMLIWGAEYMNTQAANSLLKVLEEPPEKTLFLLLTTQPEQLLTTILSRTQKVMVRAFTDEEIKEHLVTEGMCTKEASEQIAPLADGNMREAYRLVDQVQDENTAQIRDWYRLCFTLKIGDILKLSEDFAKKDKEAQKSLFLSGLNVLREVILSKSQLSGLMRSVPQDRSFIENLGLHVLDEEKISNMYTKMNQAHYHLERNANAKILFTDLSFQLARIMRKKTNA
ncbi:ATP-binding protein [Belliella marina]|uniref:ATP-binding protein n=1 Tax=Belliella marina TaxID=1644146 RepID=A0ABW4VLJ8_9BACT